MPKYVILLVLLSAVGCARASKRGAADVTDSKSQELPAVQGIHVGAATSGECPAGGRVYFVYLDVNRSSAFDEADTVLNEQIVCNGQNGAGGQNGYSTLFSLKRVNMAASTCASGAGVQVHSGLDVDRSGELEASEISSVQMICDGETGAGGATGASGTPGSNGHGVVFETVAASAEVCPAGGATLLLALDVNDDGVYRWSLPNQQAMTLCNGSHATVSAYSPVEPIMACGVNVAYKEVLLLLKNGQILGSFSNDTGGTMTRLAFLPDGTFTNTDNSGCTFSLTTSADGALRSISWDGMVQKIWSMLGTPGA